MAAKVKKAYFCKNCGFEAPKWLGKCPSCGEWNTFTEEIIARESGPVTANVAGPLPTSRPQRVRDIRESEHRRVDLGNPEVNRVLGGGMVPGSLVLLGGEPGIGKSTLSLQIALAANGLKTLYVSGEESAEQIKMRAARIGIGNDECLIYPETLLENIIAQIAEQQPDLVVIDSIQTIYHRTARLVGRQRLADPRVRRLAAQIRQNDRYVDLHHRTHHQGRRHRRSQNPRTHRRMSSCSSRATATTSTAFCAASRTASAPRSKSASSKCAKRGSAAWTTPRRSS